MKPIEAIEQIRKLNIVFGLAVEALEKSSPKEVAYDVIGACCPKCNTLITGQYGRFCDYCGQAINWEVSND